MAASMSPTVAFTWSALVPLQVQPSGVQSQYQSTGQARARRVKMPR